MARPIRRRGSSKHQFRKRVPDDVWRTAKGQRVIFRLPHGPGGDDELVSVTVGREINFSLRTTDNSLAKERQAAALAQFESFCDTIRKGPRPLTPKQRVALSGVLYRAFADNLEDDPGDPELWAAVREANEFAMSGPILGIYSSEAGARLDALERRFGKLVDLLLQREGIITDAESRAALLKEAGRALTEAAAKLERNASGDYSPDPTAQRFPEWQPSPQAENEQAKVSLMGLVEAWWIEAKAVGRKPSTYESYQNTMTAFVAYLGHDDASRVTRDDVIGFKDHRLASINPRTGLPVSPKTVKDSDLAGLKTVFGWAKVNGKMATNPAEGVTIKLGKLRKLRSKGFTDAEAIAILGAALSYRRGANERRWTYAAKRWVPWLCAYTGARVGELAQLRKCDVRCEGTDWIVTITPEAGTVKTDEARDVVLHPHLIELGFADFVQAAPQGHLFLRPASNGDVLGPLQGVKNRLAEFVRKIVPDKNVAPNHGWRHRFKTVCREAGIDAEIRDYIQGHRPRNVAESYGDVTIKAMAAAMKRLPRYPIAPLVVCDHSTDKAATLSDAR